MLAIGRALSTNPDLLMILDEATEGLAPLIVRDLVDHRRHSRDRHRVADRRPQLPHGARQHGSRRRPEASTASVLAVARRTLVARPEELAGRLGV